MNPLAHAKLQELRETLNADFSIVREYPEGLLVLVRPLDAGLEPLMLRIEPRYFADDLPSGERVH